MSFRTEFRSPRAKRREKSINKNRSLFRIHNSYFPKTHLVTLYFFKELIMYYTQKLIAYGGSKFLQWGGSVRQSLSLAPNGQECPFYYPLSLHFTFLISIFCQIFRNCPKHRCLSPNIFFKMKFYIGANSEILVFLNSSLSG